ncbi:hypothetical protein N9C75_00220 [Alphaproteobacteria bacterium]|nr:hypothetical protein [Alphaproteobacteria bacterium]
MFRSFSETVFLCYKACVGGGVDIGTAQDIAVSTTLIGTYQNEIFGQLPDLISAPQNKQHITNTFSKTANFESVLAVHNGLFLADCLQSNLLEEIKIKEIDNILLFVGICLHLVTEFSWDILIDDKFVVRISNKNLSADLAFLASGGAKNITIQKSDETNKSLIQLKPTSTIFLDAENWHALNRLAAHTYVDETMHSRISGAGAGLTDND